MGRLEITVDGAGVQVEAGTTVAAALLNAGVLQLRGSPPHGRGPLCGMGICFECRVTIDGRPHQRSCMESCRDGMEISTGG